MTIFTNPEVSKKQVILAKKAMPLTGHGVDDSNIIGGYNGQSFIDAMEQSGIDRNIATNIVKKFCKYQSRWTQIIEDSYLGSTLKERYTQLITERISRL